MDDAAPPAQSEGAGAELEVFRAGLVREAATILELKHAEQIDALGLAIEDAHEAYLIGLRFRDFVQSPKVQKKKLTKLRGHVCRTIESLEAIEPLYRFAISTNANPAGPHRNIDVELLAQDLRQLDTNICSFLSSFKPTRGNPGNNALEAAVRVLLPAVEALAATKALVSLNKLSGGSPEARSNAASSIVAIIAKFEASPSKSAILNMITKVQLSPEPTNDAVIAILRAHNGSLPDLWKEAGLPKG